LGAGKETVAMVCAAMAGVMVGVEPEQERKLLRIPRGAGNLVAGVRAFEEERGCLVQEMLVGRDGFLQMLRLVGLAGLVEVRLHVEREVREGHVVFVGLPAQVGVSPQG